MITIGRISRALAVASMLALTAPAAVSQATAVDDGSPADYEAAAEEQKLANAWVPKNRQLEFGAKPLRYVRDAAASAANNATCKVSHRAATAMVVAMTWPEVSGSGAAPSPMTLSRYDTQPSLGDPRKRAGGLWFHPGIGMWQLDSAGLGTNYTAAQAMDSKYAANRMAPYIVDKYCAKRKDGAKPAAARAYAWRDWVACRQGACEDTFRRALNNGITPLDSVGRHGGAQARTCWYRGAAHDCTYVNPANAQGSAWWAAPNGGRSPIAAPFYVMRLGGSHEVRYWLARDSGAASDVEATRPLGSNARTGLSWSAGPGMCDLSKWRGAC